ncbi:GtrA family protein [Taibaiella koreensis]|uniref:GtrA family protein n=1 Tax=Taibaiella koreensis TaxID=1268548 RepID=UPI000E59E375|nr:GtrA family protein [Taibaiella koreensis]
MKHYRDSRKLNFARNIILKVIDFFHPPFSRWIPIQTFRYIACGGSVTVLGLLLFFIGYNYILPPYLVTRVINGKSEEVLPLGESLTMTRYIGAYVISFMIGFPVGFFLSKFVVFQESHLKGRVQLFRYATLQFVNIVLNYYLLHFFAGWCGFWATPSQTLTTAILAVFSYFFQRHISFRTKKDPAIMGIPAIEEEKA